MNSFDAINVDRRTFFGQRISFSVGFHLFTGEKRERVLNHSPHEYVPPSSDECLFIAECMSMNHDLFARLSVWRLSECEPISLFTKKNR